MIVIIKKFIMHFKKKGVLLILSNMIENFKKLPGLEKIWSYFPKLVEMNNPKPGWFCTNPENFTQKQEIWMKKPKLWKNCSKVMLAPLKKAVCNFTSQKMKIFKNSPLWKTNSFRKLFSLAQFLTLIILILICQLYKICREKEMILLKLRKL